MQDHKQKKVEQDVETEDNRRELAEISGAEELRDAAKSLAKELDIQDYKGVGTNLGHGHPRKKHDVRDSFNVNSEFGGRYFHYDFADHAAPHELLARKEEFINAPMSLFNDTHDDDPERWAKIKRVASNAPVPDETSKKLKKISNQEI